MPCTFNLELVPGQHVALDTTVSSDELDMARMEDGTLVDGKYWGKLDIVHKGDTHTMEFSGTRLANQEYTTDFLVDSRVMTKLAVAAKPASAKCHLSILAPTLQYCDVILSPSSLWTLGTTWPPAESVVENKVKYFLRVHPGGALEHFESELVTTALYYEAMCVTLLHYPCSVAHVCPYQTRPFHGRSKRLRRSKKRLRHVLPRFYPTPHERP